MNRHERRAKKKDPRLEGAEIRYEGRTLELRVYVNTDEDQINVLERIRKAVKSAPNSPMVAITVGEIGKEQSEMIWDTVINAAYRKIEGEN